MLSSIEPTLELNIYILFSELFLIFLIIDCVIRRGAIRFTLSTSIQGFNEIDLKCCAEFPITPALLINKSIGLFTRKFDKCLESLYLVSQVHKSQGYHCIFPYITLALLI